MNPRILVLDLENTPILAWVWGMYEQNVVRKVRDSYVLMCGYQWADEKRARVKMLPDYPGFTKNPNDDRALIEDVWELLNLADIVVTQNGDNFDLKILNTRFIKHGLPPPRPFKSVDTKKTSKRHFRFATNKLDNLGEELGHGRKMEHEGFSMWEKCMEGDIRAFKKMAAYCKRDVELTTKVYLHERPWMTSHPNMSAYVERDACPKCGGKEVYYRGTAVRATGKVSRFQCQACGAWSYSTKTIKTTSMK